MLTKKLQSNSGKFANYLAWMTTSLVLTVVFSAYANAIQSSSETYAQNDPTRPPNIMAVQLSKQLNVKPSYELTAIFTRNNKQYAVVNGSVLKAGDSIADMYVKEISADRVVMHKQHARGDKLVLQLSGSVSVKQVTK